MRKAVLSIPERVDKAKGITLGVYKREKDREDDELPRYRWMPIPMKDCPGKRYLEEYGQFYKHYCAAYKRYVEGYV